MINVCYVATVPTAIRAFMAPHILNLASTFNVNIVTSKKDVSLIKHLPASVVCLEIPRGISLARDLKALIGLINTFRKNKYDVVHSITPKAGLLTMLAGWICCIPIRIHTFTGQVWATKRGFPRYFLKCMDRLIVAFSTKIIVDSPSQLHFLEQECVLKNGQAIVLGDGSVCGVDTEKFFPSIHKRNEIRTEFSLSDNDILILFIGRLNTDKGPMDLAKAFNILAKEHDQVHLLVIGQPEDVTFSQIQETCKDFKNKLHYINFTKSPEAYMAASDIFCLPSYREGFGQVIIESASVGLPTVASDIYGIQDAIQNGVTGILFEVRNPEALTRALKYLILNKDIREKMGAEARIRAIEKFSAERVTSEFMSLYRQQLDSLTKQYI